MTDWREVLNPDTGDQGYSGRKLKEYVWIPKPKTDLREYRLNLKLCKEVQDDNGYFNDKLVGQYAVEQGAIYDGKLEPESYIEKYEGKDVSMQTYVSNVRMFIRIARFLGWMRYVPDQDGQYVLTDRGEALTRFRGEFPATDSGLEEREIVLESFANLCYYSVNDDPKYRNPKFKSRIFLNMLYFIQQFDICHNYELAITAFTLKDERDSEERREKLEIMQQLREGEINIGEAFRMNNLDPTDESTVNGVYDGPKVLLSFARQLDLVEGIYISRLDNSEEVKKIYEQEYQGSPHINSARKVQRLTTEGERMLTEYMGRKKIWFDEL